MSDAARPTEPIASIEHYRDLLERLNRDWRIEGYVAADGSLARRALYQVRRVLARLLGPQETFNSEVVQLVNTLAPTLSSLDQVERYRGAGGARAPHGDRVRPAAYRAAGAAHRRGGAAPGESRPHTRVERRERRTFRCA